MKNYNILEGGPIEINDRVKLKKNKKHYVVKNFNSYTDELWLEQRDKKIIKKRITNIEKIIDYKCGWE